jgi:hypothetical protein
VPWEQCCIVIKERDISYCADILAQQEPNAERLGRAAREVWESHFAGPKKFRAMLNSVVELMDKRGGTCPDLGNDGRRGSQRRRSNFFLAALNTTCRKKCGLANWRIER